MQLPAGPIEIRGLETTSKSTLRHAHTPGPSSTMRWVLRRFWPLLLLPCARAQAAGDCAGAGAAAACRCSDFSVVEVGESTSTRSSSGGALSDSCEFAHDGECDEPKLCDRGTDTSDCFSGGDVGTDGGKTMCELAGDGSGAREGVWGNLPRDLRHGRAGRDRRVPHGRAVRQLHHMEQQGDDQRWSDEVCLGRLRVDTRANHW